MDKLIIMKKLFSAIAAILIFAFSHAQTNYSYQDIDSELVSKSIGRIASANNGDLIISGYFATSLTLGSFTLTNSTPIGPGGNSQTAAFIAKRSNGNIAWAKTINLMPLPDYPSNVWIFDMTTDAAGNVYVTGTYFGKISFGNIILTSTILNSPTLGKIYTQDVFTAKISFDGVFQWAKGEGTPEEPGWEGERGISVTTDNVGNTYVTGRIVDRILKNAGNCYNSPNSPVFCVYVVKYNSTGTKVWEKRFAPSQPSRTICGYPLYSTGRNIISDGNNIYVSGGIVGAVKFGTVTLNTGSDTTASGFLLKLDLAGNTIWAKLINGSGNQLLVNNGNIYFTGALLGGTITFGPGGPTLTATSHTEWFAKYNSQGICTWAVKTGVTNYYRGGLFKHPDGNIGNLVILPSNSYSPTYFGIKEFSTVNGSAVDSTEASITSPIITSGEYIVSTATGFVYSQNLKGSYNFGGITIFSTQPTTSSYSDMMLVTYTMPAPPIAHPGSIISESSLSKIILYPNPANNQITIRNNNNKMLGTVSIYDASGKMIYQKIVAGSQTMIDVQHFSAGVYYLRSDQFSAIKFMKQ